MIWYDLAMERVTWYLPLSLSVTVGKYNNLSKGFANNNKLIARLSPGRHAMTCHDTVASRDIGCLF